ncbi:MAG: RAMP superfamily CRISPR-associated protein [Campylobacterota bacterium]|nr:RAMP superfamily CRISPR-associated protein [Campylobacterota bacterium]
MTLKYELQFFDYWHLGSGLSSGAKLDSSVIKDNDGLPYAPAKTIKGLVREMAEEFGDIEFLHRCYFANATLEEKEKKEIVSNNLQDNLYDVIASTKIEDGIAVDDSLREIEITLPVKLYGEILDIPTQDDCNKLVKSLKLIKRVGLNRNRGLGRCEFKEIRCES